MSIINEYCVEIKKDIHCRIFLQLLGGTQASLRLCNHIYVIGVNFSSYMYIGGTNSN